MPDHSPAPPHLRAGDLAIDAIWRIESPRLIAGLARFVRGDLTLAEELAQDAFVAAMQQWPAEGVPDNPGAWLLTTARRRAIDRIRRDRALHQRRGQLARDLAARRQHHDAAARAGAEALLDGHVQDDLLRLIFTACHPALPPESRVALTLRILGGLTTAEIARAYLTPESTIAQRIVRAKRTLSEMPVRFEVPAGPELAGRLASVLEMLYLIFNEGYNSTAGDDLMRPALCEEAMRLGRVLAGLMPHQPEVHGLIALMEIQASRFAARVGPDGQAILLLDQDRSRWDRLLIRRGLAALDAAERLSAAAGPGAYTLQAAIAACHARALDPAATDWARIAETYARLHALVPSPVVQLNRAVALSMAAGPQAGLDLLDTIADHPALAGYHLLPAARADMLQRLGRTDDARAEFHRAASLTRNARERDLLLRRADSAAAQRPAPEPRP